MEKKEGWLLKWTNYMKGYRKRWFVLENGVLSYYGSQGAQNSDRRGTIIVHQVLVEIETGNNFMVSVKDSTGTKSSMHLRAHTLRERSDWITALESAKTSSAMSYASELSADSDQVSEFHPASDEELSDDDAEEYQVTEEMLADTLAKLGNFERQLVERCSTLQKQMEFGARDVPGVSELHSDAALVKKTASDLLTACKDYLTQVNVHQKDWVSLLNNHDRKREKLEAELEALASDHQKLEQSASEATQPATNNFKPRQRRDSSPHRQRALSTPGATSGESSEDEFFDATDTYGSPKKSESQTGLSKRVQRRTQIPLRPHDTLSLWSLLKSCVGKDLSRIAMPVNFNEPLSFVQRLCEDLEYSHLLDAAARCETPMERLVYVAVFTASAYASGANKRTGKPFNPLLGETFELDRRAESGWKTVVEQVSHHPPICCQHTESESGWKYWQECSFSIKFRGKYIEVTPTGVAHLTFADSDDHYTWTKAPTVVHNIVVGTPWVDQHGSMTITNHSTGDTCTMKYHPYSIFASADKARLVEGKCMDKTGRIVYQIDGNWDTQLAYAPAGNPAAATSIWAATGQVAGEGMYGLTKYAVTLNELSEVDQGCCPTDARFRPDVRMMENGDFDKANKIKVSLEEAQRARRREMEQKRVTWEPKWFALVEDQTVTGRPQYRYKGGYWEAKRTQQWNNTTKIY